MSWFCLDCLQSGALNRQGRCGTCGSNAVTHGEHYRAQSAEPAAIQDRSKGEMGKCGGDVRIAKGRLRKIRLACKQGWEAGAALGDAKTKGASSLNVRR